MPQGQRQLTAGEANPRFERFKQLYITTGNARQSAIAAGYSKQYARAKAHLLALQVTTKLGSALRGQGCDEVAMAAFIRGKMRARAVKWNPKKKKWDQFEDHSTQMAAADLAVRALDGLPRGNGNGNGNGGGAAPLSVKIVFNNIPRPERPTKQPETLEVTT